MTKEHIESLDKHLSEATKSLKQSDFNHVSILLSEEEIEYILNLMRSRTEPTEEEVWAYCNARELSLITTSLLHKLISGK